VTGVDRLAALGAAAVALLSAGACLPPGGGTRAAPAPPIELEHYAESGAGRVDGPFGVVRVVDGDTLVVALGPSQRKVRLIGINAPESVDPRRAVQCFGREASARATELTDGRQVYLAFDPGQPHTDEYGRLLAYVWLDDGRLLNLALLAEGYASEYTHEQTNPYALRGHFRDACDRAAAAGLGLWAADTCAGDYRATPGPAASGG
jgi:micrococcal nuclease